MKGKESIFSMFPMNLAELFLLREVTYLGRNFIRYLMFCNAKYVAFIPSVSGMDCKTRTLSYVG